MKSYLLAAVGVIFISVIVSLLVPEGKLHKSITFVMRLICILVLIQPVTQIFDIGKSDDVPAMSFDYEYVSGVYSDHQSEQLTELLKKEKGVEAECRVDVTYENGEFKVVSVEIAVEKNNEKLFEEIYSYLGELGYINITVYAKSS